MKPIITIIIICITSLSIYPETLNNHRNRIDWVKGFIRAEGKSAITINDSGNPADNESGNLISYSTARDLSYQKSKEKAFLEAANVINNIYVYPDTKISDLIINDRELRQKISHYMHEQSKFKEIPSDHLNTSCILELRLGYLINTLGIRFPENDFPLRNDIDISTKYTSVIIDTRGLKIKPVLLPSIVNEAGLEVYSRYHISGKSAVQHLAVSYTYNENEAVKHKKAGRHPFYCTAIKSLNGNPVISDDDIKRIYSHRENLAFLKKCRVIFIIDR